MSRTHTTNGWRYEQQKKRFRRICEASDAPCHICHLRIDYSLKFPDKWSFTVDHIMPTSKGGDPYDIENMAPAHLCCNSGRGNKPVSRANTRKGRKPRKVSKHSRDWWEGGIPSPDAACPTGDSTDLHTDDFSRGSHGQAEGEAET